MFHTHNFFILVTWVQSLIDFINVGFRKKIFFVSAVRGLLIEADPPNGCKDLKPPPFEERNPTGKWILLVPRYNCSFEQKVRVAQNAGYDAVIVYNVNSDELIPMSAENGTGIFILSVFVGETSGLSLKSFATIDYYIVITGESPFNIQTHLLIPFAIVVGICFIVMIVFMVSNHTVFLWIDMISVLLQAPSQILISIR